MSRGRGGQILVDVLYGCGSIFRHTSRVLDVMTRIYDRDMMRNRPLPVLDRQQLEVSLDEIELTIKKIRESLGPWTER